MPLIRGFNSHRPRLAPQDYRISSLDFSITLALTSNLGKGVDGGGDAGGRGTADARQQGVAMVSVHLYWSIHLYGSVHLYRMV